MTLYNVGMNASGPGDDPVRRKDPQFATTHWSLVLSAGNPEGPAAQHALSELCQAYWYPLYAYVRRRVDDFWVSIHIQYDGDNKLADVGDVLFASRDPFGSAYHCSINDVPEDLRQILDRIHGAGATERFVAENAKVRDEIRDIAAVRNEIVHKFESGTL